MMCASVFRLLHKPLLQRHLAR